MIGVMQRMTSLPEWQAGALIDLHLDNGQFRQYALTGSPTRRDRFLICVSMTSQSRGGSRYIHERLKLGQTLTVSALCHAFRLLPA